MPLPLAMMIPFMGIQSAVMAKQFGENFQYGKRRISAMSNEEFNKLTPKMIQDNANAELKAMIPSMQDSITDMRQFQQFMIKEMIATIGDLLRSGLGFLLGVPEGSVDKAIQDIEHFLHGHFDLHTGEGGTTVTEPPPPEHEHTADHHEPEPAPLPTTEPTGLRTAILTNAQGRINQIIVGQNIWNLDSRVNGVWTQIKRGVLTDMLVNATESWPKVEGYRSYIFNANGQLKTYHGGATKSIYWVKESFITNIL